MVLSFTVEILPWKPQVDFYRSAGSGIPKRLAFPALDDGLHITGADPRGKKVVGVQVRDQSCRFNLRNGLETDPEIVLESKARGRCEPVG